MVAEILVVDDSAVDREVIGALLEDEGHRLRYAENGKEALLEIGRSIPDLVITDLFMPELDGLELVRQLRASHPRLPVILVTSRGNEEIAAQALRRGAASYVPKSDLPSALGDAVAEVLDAVGQVRERRRLMNGLAHLEASFTLENDRDAFQPLIAFLQEQMWLVNLCDESELTRVGVAVGEALINAAEHGNLELESQLRETDRAQYLEQAAARRAIAPYDQRRVWVSLRIDREQASITVRDQGKGFDPHSVPDPTDPQNLLKASGRGVMLMRTFLDEVRYNDSGNEVTMVKRRRSASPDDSKSAR